MDPPWVGHPCCQFMPRSMNPEGGWNRKSPMILVSRFFFSNFGVARKSPSWRIGYAYGLTSKELGVMDAIFARNHMLLKNLIGHLITWSISIDCHRLPSFPWYFHDIPMMGRSCSPFQIPAGGFPRRWDCGGLQHSLGVASATDAWWLCGAKNPWGVFQKSHGDLENYIGESYMDTN